MQMVPLTADARQALTTSLGGQRVNLRVIWSPLAQAWYLTLDHDEARLATALQLTAWERILRLTTSDFDGDLIVLAATGADETPIGRRAWVATHTLWYLTGAELAEAKII